MISVATSVDIGVRAKVLGLDRDGVLKICDSMGIKRPEKICELSEPDGARLAAELASRAERNRGRFDAMAVHGDCGGLFS